MLKTTMEQFTDEFSKTICNLTINKVYSTVIFLCVGTDRITGDTFGPIVGYKLSKLFKNKKNVKIIGDLENTVSDINIECIIDNICTKYSNPFIISIDSAISCKMENVGRIIVTKGGICLGKGLGKESYIIGDMSIKGVVARDLKNSKQNLFMLQNISLNMVMKMADIVANGVYNSIECEM